MVCTRTRHGGRKWTYYCFSSPLMKVITIRYPYSIYNDVGGHDPDLFLFSSACRNSSDWRQSVFRYFYVLSPMLYLPVD